MAQPDRPVQPPHVQAARRQQQAPFLTAGMPMHPTMPCELCGEHSSAGPVCPPCQTDWLQYTYADLEADALAQAFGA